MKDEEDESRIYSTIQAETESLTRYSRNHEEITLRVTYDEIDILILSALEYSDYTVGQIASILRYRLGTRIGYMQIVKKLEYLQLLGKVGRRRKNKRIYEYFLLCRTHDLK